MVLGEEVDELKLVEVEKSSGWMKTPEGRLMHGVVHWVGHCCVVLSLEVTATVASSLLVRLASLLVWLGVWS